MSKIVNEKIQENALFAGFLLTVLESICYAIYNRQAHNSLKEWGYMLNDEICKLRQKLDESIATGQDYQTIYNLSVELDELIAKYYLNDKNKK